MGVNPGANVCENCMNKMLFHYISTPKKCGNKSFLWGGGQSWRTLHCACYEKENSSSRFVGDVPRKSWGGAFLKTVWTRCCFITFLLLKKGGNKSFSVGRGVDWGALCTVPVMKRKIALLVFLVMCPENHGEGACVKIVWTSCQDAVLLGSHAAARLHVVQFKRNICSLIEFLEFEMSFWLNGT